RTGEEVREQQAEQAVPVTRCFLFARHRTPSMSRRRCSGSNSGVRPPAFGLILYWYLNEAGWARGGRQALGLERPPCVEHRDRERGGGCRIATAPEGSEQPWKRCRARDPESPRLVMGRKGRETAPPTPRRPGAPNGSRTARRLGSSRRRGVR